MLIVSNYRVVHNKEPCLKNKNSENCRNPDGPYLAGCTSPETNV